MVIRFKGENPLVEYFQLFIFVTIHKLKYMNYINIVYNIL